MKKKLTKKGMQNLVIRASVRIFLGSVILALAGLYYFPQLSAIWTLILKIDLDIIIWGAAVGFYLLVKWGVDERFPIDGEENGEEHHCSETQSE